MALATAARYARALADLTMKPGSGLDPQAAAGELRAFEAALAASRDLRHVLLSPAVAPPRKRALITRLAAALGLSKVVRNFLCVVVDRRRIQLLGEIRQAFQSMVDQRLGIGRAEVVSARPLSAEQQASVIAHLGRLTGRRVEASYSVDERLIGGVVARIGSTIYDGSVRGRLDGLRRRLVSEEEAAGRG